jgi:hypothetical protein
LSKKRYERLTKIYQEVKQTETGNYPLYDKALQLSKKLYPMLHDLTHKSYAEAVVRRLKQEGYEDGEA